LAATPGLQAGWHICRQL